MDTSRKFWTLLLSGIIFASLFYLIHGFQFGENNNREELPLIYEEITDETLYPVDHFVAYHTSNYTQITPFLTFFSVFFQGSELTNIKPVFLLLHLITLLLLFTVLQLFIKRLYGANYIYGLFFVLLISLISEKFIPAGRWLFINFFDPEWVTIATLFAFIYAHIAKRYLLAIILMSIAGIMYPIYVIPLFPPLIFLMYKNEYQESRVRSLKLIASYALLPALYSIYLWFISRQSAGQPFDASYIMEYIRAPWHYKIPSISFMNKKAVGFFLLMLPFILLGRKLLQGKYWERSMYLFIVGIFGTLLLTSVIHSIIRIPLLVQISPYRIGLFATALAFLLIPSLLEPWINRIKTPKIVLSKFIYVGLFVLSAGCLAFLIDRELPANELSQEVSETLEWIRENTGSNDLFINYSGIDIRTQALRSSYFEFKTIPLTADGQMEWYQRFLKYNNQKDMIHPLKLQDKIAVGRSIEQFGVFGKDKFEVVENIDQSIAFVVTTVSDSATIKTRETVFNNNHYAILKIDHLKTNK